MKKEIICTICPVGCNISVEGDSEKVTSIEGYECKRGIEYGTSEFLHPVRILTTLVKVDGSETPLLPVRSNKPISKELIMECMKVIKEVTVVAPVKSNTVIISNICGSDADIVATASVR